MPAAKTQMTLRSKTHKGDGFNELRFEDEGGKQELFMHAQKDMNTMVLNDRSTTVQGHHTEAVTKNQNVTVTQDQNVTVIQDQNVTVIQDQNIKVTKDQNTTITKDQNITVSKEQAITVKEGNRTVTVTAGDEITNVGQGNLTETISKKRSTEAKEIQVDAKKTQLYTATDQINLEVGAGTIVMTKEAITLTFGPSSIQLSESGVVIKGPGIHLND